MKKRLILTASFFILNYIIGYSQGSLGLGIGTFQPPINYPSSNAASLGVYGSTSVSLFTGTPDISIPLYNIQCNGMDVPISLSYHPSNLKVDTHPGWVGLGWTLQAGGQIVRKVNGEIDEWRGQNWKYGYLDEFSYINRDDWNTPASLYEFSEYNKTLPVLDLMADEFSFNFLQYSGKIFFDNTGHWKVISDKYIKVEKVEFNDFFHLRNDLQVTNLYENANRYINKFTLITPDGVKFVFGSSDGKANEYSVPYRKQNGTPPAPTTWYLTHIIMPEGQEVTFEYETSDNPGGDNINGEIVKTYMNCSLQDYFNYELTYSHGNQIPCTDGLLGLFSRNSCFFTNVCPVGPTFNASFNAPANGFLLFPVYLSKITFPNGTLEFSRSKSNELRYNYYDSHNSGQYQHYNCQDQDKCGTLTWYKLDNIMLRRNDSGNSVVKRISLNYINNDQERLKLAKIIESNISIQGTEVLKNPYLFSYNENKLPEYCSGNEDHWGFHNGRNVKSSESNYAPNVYFTFREPDATGEQTQFEILQKVTYPTGGYTSYEFEPNHYEKVVNEKRVVKDTVEKIGCGLRIKKIKDYSSEGEIANIREYLYIRNYTPNRNVSLDISSGILSGKIQYEFFDYSFADALGRLYDQYVFSSTPKFPIGETANGSCIGYSEVAELNIDANSNLSGYTTYKFTNFDEDIWSNSHSDSPATNINSNLNIYSPFWSRALERGKPVSIESFKSNGDQVQLRQFKYSASGTSFVRLIQTSFVDLCLAPGGTAYFGSAYGEFSYRYDKTWTRTVDYDNNGNQNVSVEKYFQCDPLTGLLKEVKTFNSDGKETWTQYKYPLDYIIPDNVTLPEETYAIKSLQDSNNISPVIEQQTFLTTGSTTKLLSGKLVKYKDFRPGILQADLVKPKEEYVIESTAPLSDLTESSIGTGNTLVYHPDYKRRIVYDSYDEEGNLLQFHKENDINNSILWSYNKSFPVASIKNVGNSLAYNTTIETSYGTIPYDVSTTGTISSEFTTNITENITIAINYGGNPGVDKVSNFHYNLTGPSSSSNDLCVCSLNGGCTGFSNTITLPDMPAGTYTLSVAPNINNANCRVNITYQYKNEITTSTLSTEIYYQSFEEYEGANASSFTIPAYAGNFYKYGTFTVPFAIPNSKSYIVEYHYWDGSKWVNVKEPFTNNMTLSDGSAIDEVRVHPSDAQMSTFTYDPLIGMTSSTDENNVTTYYEYDSFGRLHRLLDRDKNVLKEYEYHYQYLNP